MNVIDEQATALTRSRYDRKAHLYDRLTRGSERMMTPCRPEICGWILLSGSRHGLLVWQLRPEVVRRR